MFLSEDEQAKVKEHYEKGQGSIQDIARTYRVPVAEVLHIIGQDDMLSVTTQGDLIDDAGPGAQINYGNTFPVQFTTD